MCERSTWFEMEMFSYWSWVETYLEQNKRLFDGQQHLESHISTTFNLEIECSGIFTTRICVGPLDPSTRQAHMWSGTFGQNTFRPLQSMYVGLEVPDQKKSDGTYTWNSGPEWPFTFRCFGVTLFMDVCLESVTQARNIHCMIGHWVTKTLSGQSFELS